MTAIDRRSPEAKAWRPLYKTAQWQQLRKLRLSTDPLCTMCKEQGFTTAAQVVDHRIAHKGDVALFFDFNNTQSLCKPHHDGAAQQRDRTGKMRGCDANGWPLDQNRHWPSK